MPNLFVISDTHFGHANILNFKLDGGGTMRTFASVEEMDEAMIERWNSVVRQSDKIYHLGDVGMTKDGVKLMARCNGHKRLIRGNHDKYPLNLYREFFEEVHGTRLLDGLLLSHIPIHPLSLGKAKANVHGHVHNNVPDLHFGPQYFNVSVEVIDYTPVDWSELKKLVSKRLNP